MPFKINEFVAQLSKTGIAKNANFEIQITPPVNVLTNQNKDVYSLVHRASAVNWPGRGITAAESKVYGPVRKIAMDSTFNDVAITFILSEDMGEQEFFEAWQDVAVGKYRKEQTLNNFTDLAYYDDYKGTITITHFSETGEQKYKIQLIDAWPINVEDIARSWETNDVISMSVTFTYHYIKDVGINQ